MADGKEIPSGQIVRGFSIDDKVVLFDDDEIRELKGSLEHSIEIIDFVPSNGTEFGPLGHKYFVVPRGTGKARHKGYSLLVSAMQTGRVCAIVRYVLRSKQYTGVLTCEGQKGFEYLSLCQLPYPDEVVDLKTIPGMADYFENKEPVVAKELKQARTLIDAMKIDRFVAEKYRDEFKDKVLARVERKLAAKDRKSKSNVIPITRNRRAG